MGFLTSGLFWGLILVLIGLSIITKILFNFEIPIFEVVVGLLLIYIGLQVLFGNSFRFSRRLFKSKHSSGFVKSEGNEYNIIFGSSTIDLSDRKVTDNKSKISINVVFGQALIWIDADMEVVINTDTVFGETILPDRKASFFSDDKIQYGSDPALIIDIDNVFGSVTVKRKAVKVEKNEEAEKQE